MPYWPRPYLYEEPAKPKKVNAEKLVAISVKNRIIDPNDLFARK